MLLTPTYHVFEMYKVHHDALLIPLTLRCGDYEMNGLKLPVLSASASRNNDGVIHVSIVNIHPRENSQLEIDLRGQDVSEVSARILTSGDVGDHNTFEQPGKVKPAKFDAMKLKNNILKTTVPAKSIVVFEIM